LCFYVLLSACQKTPKAIIFFEYTKHTLNLNRSVHTEKCSFVARQSFKRFGSMFKYYLVYFNSSVTRFRFMAFISVRTSSASVITVILGRDGISVFSSLSAFTSEFELSSVRTEIFISPRIVIHIFYGIRISPVASSLTYLVILRFNKAILSVLCKIKIILTAFVSCIRYYVLKYSVSVPSYSVQKRY